MVGGGVALKPMVGFKLTELMVKLVGVVVNGQLERVN